MLSYINREDNERIKIGVFLPLLKMAEEGKIGKTDYCTIIYQLTGDVNVFYMEWVLFKLEELKLDSSEIRGTLSLLLSCHTHTREDKIIRKTFEGFRKIRRYKPKIPFGEYTRVVNQWIMNGNDCELLGNFMRLSMGIDYFWEDFSLDVVMFGQEGYNE